MRRASPWVWFALVGCGRFGFADRETAGEDAAPTAAAVCWPAWQDGSPPLSAPLRIAELASSRRQSNPSLSPDDLTLYFDANGDLFASHRNARDAPWQAPLRIDALASTATESRMTTSDGGEFAVFVSSRAGTSDLWTATRADARAEFADPTPGVVAALNTDAAELDPELSTDGLSLYYAPYDGVGQLILVASRANASAAFGDPHVLNELQISIAVADPSLSPDETVLAFSSGATMPDNELFVATRRDRASPFGPPVPLAALNVDGVSDGDVELSSDGCEVYFTSDRSGLAELYVATVLR